MKTFTINDYRDSLSARIAGRLLQNIDVQCIYLACQRIEVQNMWGTHLFIHWSFLVQSGRGSKERKKKTKYDKRRKMVWVVSGWNHIARTSLNSPLKFCFNFYLTHSIWHMPCGLTKISMTGLNCARPNSLRSIRGKLLPKNSFQMWSRTSTKNGLCPQSHQGKSGRQVQKNLQQRRSMTSMTRYAVTNYNRLTFWFALT